ncbi:MAG: hypothetical protein O9333_14420 [Beijerinckiaceae bacterium]|nr:hypothetical protein [Beijerinckiaceae bacterium]
MAHAVKMDTSSRMKSHAEQKRLCQRMTLVTAALLVPFVLLRRAFRRLAGQHSGSRPVSVFTEARADASAIIPYIFMG